MSTHTKIKFIAFAMALFMFLLGFYLIEDPKVLGGVFLVLWANNIVMRLDNE